VSQREQLFLLAVLSLAVVGPARAGDLPKRVWRAAETLAMLSENPYGLRWAAVVCRRVSSNGWQRSFPYEGCGSFCYISLR
jgi:hypothetical protein